MPDRKPYRNPYLKVEGEPALPLRGKKKRKRRKAKKPKRVYNRRTSDRPYGHIGIRLEPGMFEALQEVRWKLSRIRGTEVSLSVIVKMYLEKGLKADKALPRPFPDPPPGL